MNIVDFLAVDLMVCTLPLPFHGSSNLGDPYCLTDMWAWRKGEYSQGWGCNPLLGKSVNVTG